MKLAIMQPYIFPYIGYFQLISLADHFVVYDDAQWMKGGWINRNRILVNGKPHYFSLPIRRASYKQRINQRLFTPDIAHHKKKILRQLQFSYAQAPHKKPVLDLVSSCFSDTEMKLSSFAVNCLKRCCEYLGINTPFTLSSKLAIARDSTAESKVLQICRLMSADHYINPIGGRHLYSASRFQEAGLRLSFLQVLSVKYSQFPQQTFHPALSIIDVMMFNTPEEIALLLQRNTLLSDAPGDTLID